MEFQAVILAAGHGSRMTDLTAKTPKALLPVANMPMIWYPVQLLERAGFQEALIVTHKSSQAMIQKALEEICSVKLMLDFVAIPDNEDWGTADTLRHIRDKIKKDLLLLSCDLITDISLHRVADVHRTYDSTLTMLMAPLADLSDSSVPGGNANRKQEHDFVGLDDKGTRVLFMSSEADFDEHVTFKKSVLKKHPFIDIRTRLLDGHLYIMKKWVVDFLCLESNSSISSIKGELIPYLVRKQFTQPKQSKNKLDSSNDEAKEDIYSYANEEEYTKLAREYSSWNDHRGDLEDCYQGDKIRCYAFIMDGGFCIRANTLLTYCEANRQVPRQLSVLAPHKDIPMVHSTISVPQKSTVGTDSMVGAGTAVGEKVGIKRSVIGSHCNISEKAKVHNSVVMDHVQLQEGVSLSGCIVCSNAQVGEKCELKDCIVGASQNISAMGKYTNEILVERDRMMEID